MWQVDSTLKIHLFCLQRPNDVRERSHGRSDVIREAREKQYTAVLRCASTIDYVGTFHSRHSSLTFLRHAIRCHRSSMDN